jgi:hypothetical protein
MQMDVRIKRTVVVNAAMRLYRWWKRAAVTVPFDAEKNGDLLGQLNTACAELHKARLARNKRRLKTKAK